MDTAKHPLKQSFIAHCHYQGLRQSGENVKISEPTQRNKRCNLQTRHNKNGTVRNQVQAMALQNSLNQLQ